MFNVGKAFETLYLTLVENNFSMSTSYFLFKPKFWNFSLYIIQYIYLNSSETVRFVEMPFRHYVCFEIINVLLLTNSHPVANYVMAITYLLSIIEKERL